LVDVARYQRWTSRVVGLARGVAQLDGPLRPLLYPGRVGVLINGTGRGTNVRYEALSSQHPDVKSPTGLPEGVEGASSQRCIEKDSAHSAKATPR
jgi:hypothetical protein